MQLKQQKIYFLIKKLIKCNTGTITHNYKQWFNLLSINWYSHQVVLGVIEECIVNGIHLHIIKAIGINNIYRVTN